MTLLGVCDCARAQDWPQWRGPAGQGTTSAKNLPPSAGLTSLDVRWKTAIPGEGCSSPIVSQGRVYVTTAYEGSEAHPLDRPVLWAIVILACGVAGLTLTRLPSVWRACASQSLLMTAIGVWTLAIVLLTTVVLAKPRWFWQFADPWTGTTVAPADLPWVESLNLRPVIVLACGSLALIYILLGGKDEGGGMKEEERKAEGGRRKDEKGGGSYDSSFLLHPSSFLSSFALTLVALRPDWFYQANQPWLAWLVTGGLGLFAIAGSISLLEARGKVKLLLIAAAFALAGWLFVNTPTDEFAHPLSLKNRVIYLVPALLILAFLLLATRHSPLAPLRLAPRLSPLASLLLAVLVFVRANYLQQLSGVVRAVVCLDAKSGHVLWNSPVYVAAAERRHSLNSLATPTAACDGERIYAYFGSGLAALDMEGKVLWLKRDADFADYIRYGAGSSVALAGDKIILYRDSEFIGHGDHLHDDIHNQPQRRPSALTAYDKVTGAEAWSITPAFSHDSYMTPLVWTRDDRLEVVIATWKTLAGFAASDGALLWSHPHPMQQIVPSLAVNGDCLIVTGGNSLPAPMIGVRVRSSVTTRATKAQTLWMSRTTGGNIVSPVCWEGLLFAVSHADMLSCLDAETGSIRWTARLGSRCLASPVAGDGKLYVLDNEGTLSVYAADTTGELLASHSFEESCSATPAIAEGALFVRSAGHVYRVGRP